MRAVYQREFGGPDVLHVEEVESPTPGSGQVRIAVEAAGVHLVDTVLRRGEPGGPFALPALPAIPGREVAGLVDAGEAEWIGRRVVAHLGVGAYRGGYAEFAVADAASLHELGDDVDATEAVAMIGTGRTTMAVLDDAGIGRDDVVVVTAAAGGIGNLLVQAAHGAGAVVAGLASGSKLADVVAAGADVAVDYTVPDWPDKVRAELGERSPTLVVDGVGGEIGRGAFELLGVGGRLVMFGWSSGSPVTLATEDLIGRGLTVTWAIGPKLLQRPGALRAYETLALDALTSGALRSLVSRYALDDAATAHTDFEARRTTGKVVLLP